MEEKKQPKPIVTRETVDNILALDGKINEADEIELSLAKELMGMNKTTATNSLIASLLNADTRRTLNKRITNEKDVIEQLSDPFSAALLLAGMSKEERRSHWKLLSICNQPAAAEISGNDNGSFNSKWNNLSKESTALNELYARTKDDYSDKLNGITRILDIVK